MAEWIFLTNHGLVISLLAKQPQITAREVATAIGITERAVWKIIADLDGAGYITKKKEGRGLRYSINSHLKFRHNTYREVAIGDFLKVLGWKGKTKQTSIPVACNEESE